MIPKLTFLGVQADNGTLLVGGGKSSKEQVVFAANTKIMYTRKKGKYRDLLKISGPTNAFLRVVVSKSVFFSLSIVLILTLGRTSKPPPWYQGGGRWNSPLWPKVFVLFSHSEINLH